ncbi:YesL family protein [Bacillus sp. B1-b2]|nr:YesL family protein [Bacillus sp. B1-b2]
MDLLYSSRVYCRRFFPSTVATFSVIRKLLLKEVQLSILSTFWSVYKK